MSTVTTGRPEPQQPRFRKNLQATLKRRERCRKKQLPSRSAIGKLFEALRFQGSRRRERRGKRRKGLQQQRRRTISPSVSFLSGSNHPKLGVSRTIDSHRLFKLVSEFSHRLRNVCDRITASLISVKQATIICWTMIHIFVILPNLTSH